ncbi:DNA-directed RNA polymerase subunit alpha C-terminal domain-containing protein [Methylobacterium mesophilicum]
MASLLTDDDTRRRDFLRRVAAGSRVSSAAYEGEVYRVSGQGLVHTAEPLPSEPSYNLFAATLTDAGRAELERLESHTLKTRVAVPADLSGVSGHPDDAVLSGLPLTTRTANALKCAGLATVGDVRRLARTEGSEALLKLANVGRKSLVEVEAIVG